MANYLRVMGENMKENTNRMIVGGRGNFVPFAGFVTKPCALPGKP